MHADRTVSRRAFLAAGAGLAAGAALWAPRMLEASPRLRVTGFELLPVRATERTVWLIVRLRTDVGLTGLGEASDAFGFANTTKQDATRMEAELARILWPRRPESRRSISGPFASRVSVSSQREVWSQRRRTVRSSRHCGTSPGSRWTCRRARSSADRFGRRCRCMRTSIARPVRARRPDSRPRREAAVRDGFRAVKAAPFDGFPPPGSPTRLPSKRQCEGGIAPMAAMREVIGPDIELMVDCHSFFDVPLAERVAKQAGAVTVGVVRRAGATGAR